MIPSSAAFARSTDGGYVLVEVLVAAAIAAGVIAAVATGLGVALNGARKASAADVVLVEASTIAARLHVGMTPADALQAMPGWSLAFKTIPAENIPRPQWKAYFATARHSQPEFDFTTVIVRAATEPIDAK